ncbi:hypothetical protein M413DRAFT_119624 [Hebeloma cylindrosporum]|uniref:Uncharacterized protein n=1 Tax=Hebeloma cylindrosporum TaxID=76867 RepID=A0A0C2YNC0_HEBCY|nr:hypothetical protein M413DRAFT_119624 [Hebeloma cylindrosporum h7]
MDTSPRILRWNTSTPTQCALKDFGTLLGWTNRPDSHISESHITHGGVKIHSSEVPLIVVAARLQTTTLGNGKSPKSFPPRPFLEFLPKSSNDDTHFITVPRASSIYHAKAL